MPLIVQRVSPSYFLILSVPWESSRFLRTDYRNTKFKMHSYIFFILNYEHGHLWRVELSKEKRRSLLLLVHQLPSSLVAYPETEKKARWEENFSSFWYQPGSCEIQVSISTFFLSFLSTLNVTSRISVCERSINRAWFHWRVGFSTCHS